MSKSPWLVRSRVIISRSSFGEEQGYYKQILLVGEEQGYYEQSLLVGEEQDYYEQILLVVEEQVYYDTDPPGW